MLGVLLDGNSRRNAASIISGIAGTYQSYIGASDLSKAVNESLEQNQSEQHQALLEKLRDLYQQRAESKSIVSGILHEIATFIDAEKWDIDTSAKQKTKADESQQDAGAEQKTESANANAEQAQDDSNAEQPLSSDETEQANELNTAATKEGAAAIGEIIANA